MSAFDVATGLQKLAVLMVLFMACLGAGKVLRMAIRLPVASPFTAIDGAALLVVAAGVLALLGLSGLYPSLALYGTAALAGVAMLRADRALRVDIGSVVFLSLVAVVVVTSSILIAIPPSLGPDDRYAYLPILRQQFTLGSVVAQPFSERRLFTYGGHFNLDGIVDHFFGSTGLAIVDPALGYLLVASSVLAFVRGRVLGSAIGFIVLVVLIVLVGVLKPIRNSVPVLLPLAFSFRLMASAMQIGDRPNTSRTGVILGLVAAASLTFRMSNLPLVLSLVVVLCMLAFFEGRPLRRGLFAAVACAASFAMCLVPFALTMQASSATMMFPVLGTGTHVSRVQPDAFASGSFLDRLANALLELGKDPTVLMCVTLLVLFAFCLHRSWTLVLRTMLVFGAVLASCFAVTFATEGVDSGRYFFPFTGAFLVTVALAGADVLAKREDRYGQLLFGRLGLTRLLYCGLALTCIFAAALLVPPVAGKAASLLHAAENGLIERYASHSLGADEEAAVVELTKRLPAGSRVLVYWDSAYLLTFREFNVILNDQPLRAGPGSFWPKGEPPLQTLAYLADNGIEYVISAPSHEVLSYCGSLDRLGTWYRNLYGAVCRFDGLMNSRETVDHIILRQDGLTLLKTLP